MNLIILFTVFVILQCFLRGLPQSIFLSFPPFVIDFESLFLTPIPVQQLRDATAAFHKRRLTGVSAFLGTALQQLHGIIDAAEFDLPSMLPSLPPSRKKEGEHISSSAQAMVDSGTIVSVSSGADSAPSTRLRAALDTARDSISPPLQAHVDLLAPHALPSFDITHSLAATNNVTIDAHEPGADEHSEDAKEHPTQKEESG